MSKELFTMGVIGGGAWGTALASVWAMAGIPVTLWARDRQTVDDINQQHENKRLLPGRKLPAALRATYALSDLAHCDALTLALPAQITRPFLSQLPNLPLAPKTPLILVAKGVDLESNTLLGDVVAESLSAQPIIHLSGPSFATEVAAGLPTALTLACRDNALASLWAQRLTTSTMRLYHSTDVVGVQIGGALKNVLAIACGIIEGRALGNNARSAIITRGLAELTRLGLALGAQTETLMGLSGVGDLILTCTSPLSRNMSLGIALGKGLSLADALAASAGVAEGATTARAALNLAAAHHIDMPITAAVDRVLSGTQSIDDAINNLLSRPLKAERS